jgi:hypothetical protein
MLRAVLCVRQAGKRRAEQRHKFMEQFLAQFYEEVEGRG